MIQISFTNQFIKAYDKLTKVEQTLVDRKIILFKENIMHPSLRVKKIKGYKNRFEFSVNMDIRVIWKYDGDNIVVFLDVGHHDII